MSSLKVGDLLVHVGEEYADRFRDRPYRVTEVFPTGEFNIEDDPHPCPGPYAEVAVGHEGSIFEIYHRPSPAFLVNGQPVEIFSNALSPVEDTPLEESHDDWDPAEVIAAKDQQIALLEKEQTRLQAKYDTASERATEQAKKAHVLDMQVERLLAQGRERKDMVDEMLAEVKRLKRSNKWLDTTNANLWKEVTELRLLKGRTGIHPGAETWSKVNGERLIAVREPLDVEVEYRKKNLVRCLNRRGEAQWRYRTELTRTKPTSRLRTIGAPLVLMILSVILGVCL